MDVPREILIDAAVNAIGYLAAGACTVLLYSLVIKRGAKQEMRTAAPTVAPVSEQKPAAVRDNGQYVPLSRSNSTVTTNDYQKEGGRRDRQEIMRIARQMLKAGATVSRIREVLPLTTAEATLLAQAER